MLSLGRAPAMVAWYAHSRNLFIQHINQGSPQPQPSPSIATESNLMNWKALHCRPS